ncbi:uncharacterized protein LOC142566606 [Dermacentor variabilis]|uniref:uncharacterized protein LOC142566606 n=1 Tax=Dermacentor variabilis TaxID=34621 RepID=UPI003F5C852E
MGQLASTCRSRYGWGARREERRLAQEASAGTEPPEPLASQGGGSISQAAGPSKSPSQEAQPAVDPTSHHDIEDFSTSASVMTQLSLVLMQPGAGPSKKPDETGQASPASDHETAVPDDAVQVRSLFCFGF